jgi:hypothetical protein
MLWQQGLDQASELTTTEACGSLLEPCFQPTMVELLNLEAQVLTFEVKKSSFVTAFTIWYHASNHRRGKERCNNIVRSCYQRLLFG